MSKNGFRCGKRMVSIIFEDTVVIIQACNYFGHWRPSLYSLIGNYVKTETGICYEFM